MSVVELALALPPVLLLLMLGVWVAQDALDEPASYEELTARLAELVRPAPDEPMRVLVEGPQARDTPPHLPLPDDASGG